MSKISLKIHGSDRKKNKIKVCLIVLFLFVFLVGILGFVKVFFTNERISSSSKLKLAYHQTGNSYNNCKLVEITDIEDAVEFSFDGGETWGKENSKVLCQTDDEIVILARDENEIIIGKDEILIEKNETLSVIKGEQTFETSFNQQSYSCKIGETLFLSVNSTPVNIDGDLQVKANNDNITSQVLTPMCINCTLSDKIIRVECMSVGNTTITAFTNNDISTSTTINVYESNSDIPSNTISYEKSSYSCNVGEEVDTIITANKATISSFSSSNNSFVTISHNPDYKLRCYNCVAVRFKCLKEGTTTLVAKSSDGAETASIVTVRNSNPGAISFTSPSYTCSVGETMDTVITATAVSSTNDIVPYVAEYSSTNSEIASISKNPDYTIKCFNCLSVRITCLKEGTTAINAVSSSGARVTANVTVKKLDVGSISYDKSTYNCEAGKSINAVITANANSSTIPTVTGFSSSNNSVASVINNPDIVVKCANCRSVKIDCISPGSAELSATSSKGAKTTSTVNVKKPDIGSISFSSTSYVCTEGESFDTIITSTSSGDIIPLVENYSSSNTSIVSISRNPDYSLYCANCIAVRVNCLQAGTTSINASSTLGASVSANVTVNPIDPGKISYDKTSYSCTSGEKISAVITATSSNSYANVVSYSSNNNEIASVEKNPNLTVKCINCVSVQINCEKAGKTELTAVSSTGATTHVYINVKAKEAGTISFAEGSYFCSPGEVIDSLITAKSNEDPLISVSSFSSSDPGVVSINKHPTLTSKCWDCKLVQMKCIKKGTAVMTAVSSSGSIGTTTITVK